MNIYIKYTILFLLIHITFTQLCFSNDTIIIQQQDLYELNNKVNSLETQIEELKQENNENLVLEYKHIISLFSWGVGFLLALFGLVFPFILYFVQIKPTNESLKDTKALIKSLDDDFDKSIEKRIKKNRNILIDEAIKIYKEQNTSMISNAHSTLDTRKNEGFNELQVVKIIKLIKNNKTPNEKEFLNRILTFQEDINIEDYFIDLINNNPQDKNCIWGALYFANYDQKEHLPLISKIVLNGYSLVGMLLSICSSSTKYALSLIDDSSLVDSMTEDKINQYVSSGIKYLIEKTDKDSVEDTLLWKKYIENKAK